jgi:hypothetical protein
MDKILMVDLAWDLGREDQASNWFFLCPLTLARDPELFIWGISSSEYLTCQHEDNSMMVSLGWVCHRGL